MTNTTTATKTTEAGKPIRNFKQNSDIEAFYRFTYENGLRREAGIILSQVVEALGGSKKKSKKKRAKKAKKIQ